MRLLCKYFRFRQKLRVESRPSRIKISNLIRKFPFAGDIQTVAWYHYDKASETLNVIKLKMVDIRTTDGHPERQIDIKVEIII